MICTDIIECFNSGDYDFVQIKVKMINLNLINYFIRKNIATRLDNNVLKVIDFSGVDYIINGNNNGNNNKIDTNNTNNKNNGGHTVMFSYGNVYDNFYLTVNTPNLVENHDNHDHSRYVESNNNGIITNLPSIQGLSGSPVVECSIEENTIIRKRRKKDPSKEPSKTRNKKRRNKSKHNSNNRLRCSLVGLVQAGDLINQQPKTRVAALRIKPERLNLI